MKFARTFGFAVALATMLFVAAIVGFCSDAGATLAPRPPDGHLCGPLGELESFLETKWSEQIQWAAPFEKFVIAFYLSPAGTWTVIETKPNGDACILRGGSGLEDLHVNPQGRNLGER